MLIKLVQDDAESRFLESLEGNSAVRGVLLCDFSRANLPFSPDGLLPYVKDMLGEYDAAIYFCKDGDVAISWRGMFGEISDNLQKMFMRNFPKLDKYKPQEIFRFYDTVAQGEYLRIIFRDKLRLSEPEKSAPQPTIKKEIIFSAQQQENLTRAIAKRKTRKLPEILIVEDQDFSRKLLMAMLEPQYKCHYARNGAEAVNLYVMHAPDITFLDVELPDASGHNLAALFNKFDPAGFVTMVTANHQSQDVEAAQQNKVQGFIVKPYNKQKILDTLSSFLKRRNTVK